MIHMESPNQPYTDTDNLGNTDHSSGCPGDANAKSMDDSADEDEDEISPVHMVCGIHRAFDSLSI